jgi:acyl transferase domain-containing protein
MQRFFWLSCYDLPWLQVFGDNTPSRVKLPTYPFANEEYWAVEDSENPSRGKGLPEQTFGDAEKPSDIRFYSDMLDAAIDGTLSVENAAGVIEAAMCQWNGEGHEPPPN